MPRPAASVSSGMINGVMAKGKGKQRLLASGKTITDWEEEALCGGTNNLCLCMVI